MLDRDSFWHVYISISIVSGNFLNLAWFLFVYHFMIKVILCAIVLMFVYSGFSQQTSLDQFNIERQKISKNGVKGLVIYSVSNIIYSTIAASNSSGSQKYFYKMNTIWSGITIGLVGLGIVAAKKEGSLSYAESLKKQSTIEKVFLFNAGLDVAYIAGGAYLKERSKRVGGNAERRKGYGESIMLQGGVLLLFDGVMYLLHSNHGKTLNKMAEKIRFSSNETGIGLIVKL